LGTFTNKSLETIPEKSSILSNLVRDKTFSSRDGMLIVGMGGGNLGGLREMRERGDERWGLDGGKVPEGSVIRISGIMLESGRDMGDGEVLEKKDRKHYSLLYDREANQDILEPVTCDEKSKTFIEPKHFSESLGEIPHLEMTREFPYSSAIDDSAEVQMMCHPRLDLVKIIERPPAGCSSTDQLGGEDGSEAGSKVRQQFKSMISNSRYELGQNHYSNASSSQNRMDSTLMKYYD
jgi:hypothetical protein